jgi:hemerythrin
MVLHQYPEGKVFPENDYSNLYLVYRGKLQIFIGDNASEILTAGHFFGEEGVLFETSSTLQVRAMGPTEIYQIPGKLLLDIPIIRWKLLEVFKKRKEYLLVPDFKDNPIFYWRDDYSTNVKEMDDHHKELFERANKLSEVICINEEKSAVEDALNFLIDYAEYHFSEEENLLKQHNYTNYEFHREKHETLMKEILELKEKINSNYLEMDIEVLIDFFKHWIIEHILAEDKEYGPFLNLKGVF